METHHIFTCPECGSTRSWDLEREEHGRDCPLIVCCECGAEVHNKNPEPKAADMNITHTPGPWEIDGAGEPILIYAPLARGKGESRLICSIDSDRPEAALNARLIAQTPMLLSLCKEALAYLERHPYKNWSGIECEPAMCFGLREIIRRAE